MANKIKNEIREWEKFHTVPFEVKEITEVEDRWNFKGYASIFNTVDNVDDIVIPGAFKRTIQHHKGKFPLVWMHDRQEILGAAIVHEDKKGLKVDPGYMLKAVQKSHEAYPLMKDKIVNGMSFAYRVIQRDFKDGIRLLKELAVGEITIGPATMIAHPKALITQVKFAERIDEMIASMKTATTHDLRMLEDQKQWLQSFLANSTEEMKAAIRTSLPLAERNKPWDASAAKKRVQTWATSGDKINFTKYRRAFLWYDAENQELLGSYKLPIGDIIDGSLKAVPRGVIAAAAALRGARGGVRIPSSDIPGVRSTINGYYKRLDLTPPW